MLNLLNITKTKLFLSSHQELLELAKKNNIETKNKIGGNLPHVTLQNLIWNRLNMGVTPHQIKKLNTKAEPIIKRNWYVLYVHYGKENSVINSIVENLKVNAVPNFKENVNAGIIPQHFSLDSLVIDIAYPNEFNLNTQDYQEKYKSYVFIELGDIYDRRVFDNIISPFFKSMMFCVNFVGVKFKTDTRLKEQFSKGGRSVLRYYNDQKVVPGTVTKEEVERIKKEGNFSIYEEPSSDEFNVGDFAWYNISEKTRKKVQIVAVKDNRHYQVMTKDRFKFFLSINDLSKFS